MIDKKVNDQNFVFATDEIKCRLKRTVVIGIMVAIMSTAIAIYFGDWIKSVISINLITLLLLVHVVYVGIRCYVKDWMEERGYY